MDLDYCLFSMPVFRSPAVVCVCLQVCHLFVMPFFQVNLTSPELVLFKEEMPEDKTMRNYYLQLQSFRQVTDLSAHLFVNSLMSLRLQLCY